MLDWPFCRALIVLGAIQARKRGHLTSVAARWVLIGVVAIIAIFLFFGSEILLPSEILPP